VPGYHGNSCGIISSAPSSLLEESKCYILKIYKMRLYFKVLEAENV
jgi:hypothetical protein